MCIAHPARERVVRHEPRYNGISNSSYFRVWPALDVRSVSYSKCASDK